MQKLTVGSTDWGVPLNSYRAAVTGRASIPACLKHVTGVSALGGQEAPLTHLLLIYEQYLASRFSKGKSPFLNRSASNGNILSRTSVLPLYNAVR